MSQNNNQIEEFKEDWRKETEKCIRSFSCKKCNGIIVRSWSLSMLAAQHGKRCNCKQVIKNGKEI